MVNTASPVHIRQDSLIQHLAAKWIKINGEREDYHVFGDTLMYCGVRLKQAFCATGLNDEVRYFPDFGARLYFMDEEKHGMIFTKKQLTDFIFCVYNEKNEILR